MERRGLWPRRPSRECREALLLLVAAALIAGTGASAQAGIGQQVPPMERTTAASGAGDTPRYTLVFSHADPVPGVVGSPMLATPIPCSPDGVPFVLVPLPPNYQNNLVESLEQGGGHRFPYSTAPGLYDILLLSYFPAGPEVAFLVSATTDPKVSTYSTRLPDGTVVTGQGYSGSHHRYVLLFDRQGSYKSAVELPMGSDYLKLAELPDGTFLLLGYDPARRSASLAVVDQQGRPVRSVELPREILSSADLEAAHAGDELDAARVARSIASWQFIPAQQRVVLYRPGGAGAVLEFGAGGAVREVALAQPAGYILDAFVPGADGWFVRYRRSGLSSSRNVDGSEISGNFELYKVNPLDGSLAARLLTGNGSVLEEVCEGGGSMTSYSLGKNLQFQLASAPLPK